MFGEIVIVLAKCVIVSALLLTIYLVLLKGRVSYLVQRVFLLSIPLIALVSSVVSIDVFEVDRDRAVGRIVEDVVQSVGGVESRSGAHLFSKGIDDLFEPSRASESGLSAVAKSLMNPILWVALFWSFVAVYLIWRYVGSVLYIYHLRKISQGERLSGFALFRCVLVDTPFSFLRSIYVGPQLDGEKFDIVFRHEGAHINSGHYVDKMLIEIYLIIMWFNPVVWLLHRELCAVHEFEADRVVLRGYDDVKRYKQFLFDEAECSAPHVANGFNNSLIKRRFLEMKSDNYRRRGVVRQVVSYCLAAGLFALSSLTYVSGGEVEETSELKVIGAGSVLRDVDSSMIIVTLKSGEQRIYSGKSIEQVGEVMGDPSSVASVTVLKDQAAARLSLKEGGEPEVVVKRVNAQNITEEVKQMDGVDLSTDKDALQKYLETVEVRDIHQVNELVDLSNPDVALEIAKKRNNHEYYNYYFPEREQYNLMAGNYSGGRDMVAYRYDDHTEVDFIYRVAWDWHWYHFSSSNILIDPESGDQYKVHSLKGGIPLDRTSVVLNQKGYYVVFTAIYPPLKKGVKVINHQSGVTPGVRVPSDGSKETLTKDIKVYPSGKRPYTFLTADNVVTLDPDFQIEGNSN